MNEIQSILENKEKVIWEGKPQAPAYITSVVIISIIIGICVGIFLGAFLKSWISGVGFGIDLFLVSVIVGSINYRVTHYALTNRRAIYQGGIFGRSFKSVNYDDMKNASVTKGIFNWMFGTGTINVFTGEMQSTGGKYPQMAPKYDTFLYIEDAYDVLKTLQEHLTKMEQGLYSGKARA